MRAEIRSGGDGVACWNDQAILSYVDRVTAREQQLAQRNPDLVVIPGTISCFGCETQEYGYGTKCTAQIVKTTYAVADEIKPRAADAAGWHREIPGLLTIRPDSATGTSEPPVAPATDQPARPGSSENVTKNTRSGRRGLFGRSG
jgi:hypothetical protein